MATITVYRAESYDTSLDRMVRSNRYFTKKGAEFLGLQIIDGTSIVINANDLEKDGMWTAVGYTKSIHHGGLQQQVTDGVSPHDDGNPRGHGDPTEEDFS